MSEDGQPTALVTLFKRSGKYYTKEYWRIPDKSEVLSHPAALPGDYIGPQCMMYSPDFRRISGGPVLIETQEPWGFPFLIPGVFDD